MTHAELQDSPKTRLLTLDSLDGRTTAARQVRETIAALEREIGPQNLTDAKRQTVKRVASLSAICESMEAAWLGGSRVDLEAYLRALNCLNRLIESLGLPGQPRRETEAGTEAQTKALLDTLADEFGLAPAPPATADTHETEPESAEASAAEKSRPENPPLKTRTSRSAFRQTAHMPSGSRQSESGASMTAPGRCTASASSAATRRLWLRHCRARPLTFFQMKSQPRGPPMTSELVLPLLVALPVAAFILSKLWRLK